MAKAEPNPRGGVHQRQGTQVDPQAVVRVLSERISVLTVENALLQVRNAELEAVLAEAKAAQGEAENKPK